MDTFEEIMAGIELEPIAVTLVREGLCELWDDRHPDGEHREVAHRVIDEAVDDLRVNFGWGVFDRFVESQVGK